jgi:ABC-type transport system involved in multi-copper enzyme maturation permease subunit
VAILVGGAIRASGTVAELTREETLEQLFLRLTRETAGSDVMETHRVPPADAPPRGGFTSCLRAELFKLRHTRNTLAALAILLILGAFGAWRSGGQQGPLAVPHNAFIALGVAMGRCALLAAIFALVYGAGALAGENQDGTLRSALSRPVLRGALLGGKIAALAALLALFYSGALLGAATVAFLQNGLHGPLAGAELEDPAMVQSFGGVALWSSTIIAILSSYLACLAVCALALAVSSMCRRGAEAIIWSGLLFVVALLGASLFEFSPVRALIFQPYIDGPWQHLAQLGQKRVGAEWFWGNNLVPHFTGDLALDRRRASYLAITVPALQAAAFFTFAWIALRRRDVRA